MLQFSHFCLVSSCLWGSFVKSGEGELDLHNVGDKCSCREVVYYNKQDIISRGQLEKQDTRNGRKENIKQSQKQQGGKWQETSSVRQVSVHRCKDIRYEANSRKLVREYKEENTVLPIKRGYIYIYQMECMFVCLLVCLFACLQSQKNLQAFKHCLIESFCYPEFFSVGT